MLKKAIIIFVFLLPVCVFAQKKVTLFENVRYGKSFISEIRSPLTKLEIGYLNKISSNYYINDVPERPFIESHFGYDLNVFSLTNRNYKIAFSLPGGSATLTDMFEELTAPVINTDYWFGTQIKFITYPFNSNKFAKNIAVNLQPIFHESTHIGDEFSIHGYHDIPDFKRINISYEAWNLAVTLNDPDTLTGNVFSVKTGIQNLWSTRDGYYIIDSLEVKGETIPYSSQTAEYYFIFNYQRTKGFMCSEKWLNIVSVEARNRPKFSYTKDIEETRAWNFNMYFGWMYKISNKPFRNIGFFIRHYQGINPHGQFRDTDNFKFTALSITLL